MASQVELIKERSLGEPLSLSYFPIQEIIENARDGQPLHNLQRLTTHVLKQEGSPLSDPNYQAMLLARMYYGDPQALREEVIKLAPSRLWVLLGRDQERVFLENLPLTFPPPFWSWDGPGPTRRKMVEDVRAMPEFNICHWSHHPRHNYLTPLGAVVAAYLDHGSVFLIGGRAKANTGTEHPLRSSPPYRRYPELTSDVDLKFASDDPDLPIGSPTHQYHGSLKPVFTAKMSGSRPGRDGFWYMAFAERAAHRRGPDGVFLSTTLVGELGPMERAGEYGNQFRLVHFCMSEATVNQIVVSLKAFPDIRFKGAKSIGGSVVDLFGGLVDSHQGIILNGAKVPIIRYCFPEYAFPLNSTGFFQIARAVRTACELDGVFYDGQAGTSGTFDELKTSIFQGHQAVRRRINLLNWNWPQVAQLLTLDQREIMFRDFIATIKKGIRVNPRRALILLSDWDICNRESGAIGLGIAKFWLPQFNQVLRIDPRWQNDLQDPEIDGLEYLEWLAQQNQLSQKQLFSIAGRFQLT